MESYWENTRKNTPDILIIKYANEEYIIHTHTTIFKFASSVIFVYRTIGRNSFKHEYMIRGEHTYKTN